MMSSPQLKDAEMCCDDYTVAGAVPKESKPGYKQDIDVGNNISSSPSTTTPAQGDNKAPSLRRSSRRRTLAPIYYVPRNSSRHESSSSSSNSTASNYSSSPNVRKMNNEKSCSMQDDSKEKDTSMVTIGQRNKYNHKYHSSNQENIPPASSRSISSSSMSILTPPQTTIVSKKIATMSSLSCNSCTSSSDDFRMNNRTLNQIQIHPDISEKENDEGCAPSYSSLTSSDMSSLCNGISTRINIKQEVESDEIHEKKVRAITSESSSLAGTKRKLRRSQRIKRKKENKDVSSSPSLSSSPLSSSSSMSISNASSSTPKKAQDKTTKSGGDNEKEKCCNAVPAPVQNSHNGETGFEEVSDIHTIKSAEEEGNNVSESSKVISSIVLDRSDKSDKNENHNHPLNVHNSRGTTVERTHSIDGRNKEEGNSSIFFSDDDDVADIQLSKNKKLVPTVAINRRRRSLRRRKSINLPERYRDDNTLLYLKPPSTIRKDVDSPSNSVETKSPAEERRPIPKFEKMIIPAAVNMEGCEKKLVVQAHQEGGHTDSSSGKDVDSALPTYMDLSCLTVNLNSTKEEGNSEEIFFLTQENPTTEPATSGSKLPKKKRRRSSIGLHAGGFISLTDIEKIGKEAATRQRRRSCGTNGISSAIMEDTEDSSYRKGDQTDVLDKVELPSTVAFGATDEKPPNAGNGEMIPIGENINNCGGIKVGGVLHTLDPKSRVHCVPKADEIETTITAMFDTVKVLSKPCMSARIFSCAVLFMRQRTHPKDSLEILLPLLQAFVKAELASLMDTNVEYVRPKKRVHFCSIDNSSIFTPVDTKKGSEKIIENCISSTYEILKEIDNLREKENYGSHISVLTSVLEDIISSSQALMECSRAMPCHWPPSRLTFAAKYYLQELNVLCFGYKKPSRVKHTLGDSIGRAIRFYLRRFFNPLPVSLHTYSDAEQPNYDFSRSNVHKIIELTDSEGQQDTAVADGSISSVISLALLRIHQFFELSKSNNQSNEGSYISSFCNRTASQRGLQKRGSTVVLDDNDIDEILLDISESHIILSGIRACKFFHSVMTWPGVSKAINDAGGWDKIEHYAQMFMECELDIDVPDEIHFQHLVSVELLLNKIDKDLDLLCELEGECDNSLRRLWRRFRCGTKNKEVLRQNPGIKVIQKNLKAGGNTFFPSVTNC